MSASANQPVVEVEAPSPGVAVLALNRPRQLNALDRSLMEALPDVVDDLAADADVRVVVVTGRGSGFCAGADLAQFDAPPTVDGATAWMRRAHRGVLALRTMPKPTIAAVNGAAVGAGLGLALACDLRLAAPGATMSAPFVQLGVGPDFGVSRWLADAVGEAVALDLLYTGRRLDGTAALRLGLVQRLEDDPLAAAVGVAAEIAAASEEALRAIKRSVRAARQADDSQILMDLEARTQGARIADPAFQAWLHDWRAARGAR